MESQESPIDKIYARCSILQDIVARLVASQIAAEEFNASNSRKVRKSRKNSTDNSDGDGTPPRKVPSYAPKYGDFFEIIEVFKDKRWEKIPFYAKSGKDEFETALVTVTTRHNPKAIKIKVYNGKPKSSNFELFTCWVADNADSDPIILAEKEKQDGSSLGYDAKFEALEKKLETMTPAHIKNVEGASYELIKMQFDNQVKELKHEREIERVSADFKETIKEQRQEIEALEERVEELESEILDMDDELAGAADELTKKVEEPSLVTMISRGIGNGLNLAANKFIKERPALLKNWIGEENISKYLDASPDAIAGSNAPTASASFTEAKPESYPNQTDAEHIEAAASMTAFLNSLDYNQFKDFYTVMNYCTDATGRYSDERTKTALTAIARLMAEKQKQTA